MSSSNAKVLVGATVEGFEVVLGCAEVMPGIVLNGRVGNENPSSAVEVRGLVAGRLRAAKMSLSLNCFVRSYFDY